MNLSNLDLRPTLIPTLANSSLGIIKCFATVSSSLRQMQKNHLTLGFIEFRLKTQYPACSLVGFPRFIFLRNRCETFTSISSFMRRRSAPPLLNWRWSAFRRAAAYCSHLNPMPVSVLQNASVPYSFLPEYFRRCHARLMHLVEQYFFLASPNLQKSHFIMTS